VLLQDQLEISKVPQITSTSYLDVMLTY